MVMFCFDLLISRVYRNTKPYTTWIDNYSHVYHRSVPLVLLWLIIDMQWAVEAHFSSLADCSMSLQYSAGKIISMMPPDLFEATRLVKVITRAGKSTGQAPYEAWKCVIWNITTSPPHLRTSVLSDEQKQRVKASALFSSRFIPSSLHDINISSDEGLAKFYTDQSCSC